jgi:hypothetical protein
MFSACMSNSFDKQKFTELKKLSTEGYYQAIYESPQNPDDTLLSPYSIELTISSSLASRDPLYLETEKGKYKFEQPKLEMKTADVCGQELTPVTSDPYPENAAIIYATEDDIVDDTCIYISDIDEVYYEGQISQKMATKVDHNKENRNPRKSTVEPTMFPLIWLLLTILFGVLSGIMYWQHEQALASNDCTTVIVNGLFFAFATVAFGILGLITLILFLYYLTRFIEYNKQRKRA